MGVERLAGSLTRLHDALADLRLPLDIPDADLNRALAQAQAHQIQDYVVPRLRRLDAPLLAVVGGSTGAGKSTLVNSLIGRVVSESGVIRPTTRSSVLIHHPSDERWFASSQILPGLARSDAPGTDPRVLQMVPEPGLPEGLAILDAPDVDSVVAQNRTLAAQLLAAADLWLFVTSAARYADAVPWQYLREAAARRAVVAVVLDRVPPLAMSEVPTHLGQMMSQRGLASSPLFAVPETQLADSGMLPDTAVAPIRSWLRGLAVDTTRRNEVVLQTLDGAIESLAGQGGVLVQAAADQVEALATLRSDAEKSFAEATRAVAAQTADGTLLRGEVLARWQDFVGTGEFFRAVEKRIGLFRDRVGKAVRGEPKQAQEVKLAVESGLEVLIREEGEAASRRSVSAWEAHPAGRQILARDETLRRLSSDFAEAAPRVIREWQGDVLELVTTEGQSKKATARYLALGVNGAGVALMIVVFSQTGGLAGAEVGIAGGTAVLAQRVLEAVFGEDAVRRLSKQAKQQLDARVQGLMAMELARFEKELDDIDVAEIHGERLRAALSGLDVERVDPERYVHPSESAPVFGPALVAGVAELTAGAMDPDVVPGEPASEPAPESALESALESGVASNVAESTAEPEALWQGLEAGGTDIEQQPQPQAEFAASESNTVESESGVAAEMPVGEAVAESAAVVGTEADGADDADQADAADRADRADEADGADEASEFEAEFGSVVESESEPEAASEGASESESESASESESDAEPVAETATEIDAGVDAQGPRGEGAQSGAEAAEPVPQLPPAVPQLPPPVLQLPQPEVSPQPRPIPVPAELAELAAEAVRRPDAAAEDEADPASPESAAQADPSAQQADPSAQQEGESVPVAAPDAVVAPELSAVPQSEPSPQPAPTPVLPSLPVPPPVATHPIPDLSTAGAPEAMGLPRPDLGLTPPLEAPPPPEVPAWPNAEPPIPADPLRQE